jgi:hypothetical protein
VGDDESTASRNASTSAATLDHIQRNADRHSSRASAPTDIAQQIAHAKYSVRVAVGPALPKRIATWVDQDYSPAQIPAIPAGFVRAESRPARSISNAAPMDWPEATGLALSSVKLQHCAVKVLPGHFEGLGAHSGSRV